MNQKYESKYPQYLNTSGWAENGAQKLDHADAKYILLEAKKILDQNNIVFMPNFGTLLGIVRQGDFIPHDYDLDIAIFDKDREKLLDLVSEFEKVGIKMRCYVQPWIYTFEYNHFSCDFYTLREAEPIINRFCFCLLEQYVPKKYFLKTRKIEFLGEQFDIPFSAEELLAYYYGKNWRIPQKGVHAHIEPYVFVHYYAKLYFRKCIRYAKRHWLKK